MSIPETSIPETRRSTAARSNGVDRWRYGLWAVLAGLVALIVVFVAALVRYPAPGDAAAATAPALTAIGTLTAAYFGIQVGAAGKEQSDNARDAAHSEAMRFAALADPEKAAAMLRLTSGAVADGAAAGPAKGPRAGG